MRLFVLTLAASAFASPAFANDHSHHHHRHWTAAVRGHYHVVAARRYGMALAPAADERFGAFAAPPSDYGYGAARSGSRVGIERLHETSFAAHDAGHGVLDPLIARHAQMNGVPEALVRRVVMRESRYNARAVGRGGALGLMQIKYATARAMGYTGSPTGLLDPETNLTYAVRYLAGAYRVAGGNANGAVANYARGYYGAAKRVGISPYAAPGASNRRTGSYASAQPIEQVAWGGPPLRHAYAGRRSRH